ncbi:unnamed protein product [Amoebophrya sp. A25]|nr:unnamed protein product [Amoebophrya sp. A25]|eukprot:GSA25T00015736001.1
MYVEEQKGSTFGEVYATYARTGNRCNYMSFAPQLRTEQKTISSRTYCARYTPRGRGGTPRDVSASRAASRGKHHNTYLRPSPRGASPVQRGGRADWAEPCYSQAETSAPSTSAPSLPRSSPDLSERGTFETPRPTSTRPVGGGTTNASSFDGTSNHMQRQNNNKLGSSTATSSRAAAAAPPSLSSQQYGGSSGSTRAREPKTSAFIRLHDFLLRTHLGSLLSALRNDSFLEPLEAEKLGRRLEDPSTRGHVVECYFLFQRTSNLDDFVLNLKSLCRR